MRFPALGGVIERRLLINFRVDPDALSRLLPEPFAPHLVGEMGIAGVCLIGLKGIRPPFLPQGLGFSSENAAHRIAVRLPDGSGGVFIPRRDTNSRLNTLAGGRLFPGVHHHARFTVVDSSDRVEVVMRSDDGQVGVEVSGHPTDRLEPGSVFTDVPEVSDFFESGSLGYSVTADPERFDQLELRTSAWKVRPLAVDRVISSFFDDPSLFPPGSVQFDNALIMRSIEHEWHAGESLYCPASHEAEPAAS